MKDKLVDAIGLAVGFVYWIALTAGAWHLITLYW